VLPALEILAAARSPLFPDKIVELLDAPQAPVRRAALRVLVNHDQMDVEEHLVRKLQDSTNRCASRRWNCCAHGSPAAVPALVGLLVVSDELRYHAIRALGRLHAETAAADWSASSPGRPGTSAWRSSPRSSASARGAAPFLKARLKDSEAEVRPRRGRRARPGRALSELPLLVKLAQDPDWTIRNHAGWGLGRLALPQGRDALLALGAGYRGRSSRAGTRRAGGSFRSPEQLVMRPKRCPHRRTPAAAAREPNRFTHPAAVADPWPATASSCAALRRSTTHPLLLSGVRLGVGSAPSRRVVSGSAL